MRLFQSAIGYWPTIFPVKWPIQQPVAAQYRNININDSIEVAVTMTLLLTRWNRSQYNPRPTWLSATCWYWRWHWPVAVTSVTQSIIDEIIAMASIDRWRRVMTPVTVTLVGDGSPDPYSVRPGRPRRWHRHGPILSVRRRRYLVSRFTVTPVTSDRRLTWHSATTIRPTAGIPASRWHWWGDDDEISDINFTRDLLSACSKFWRYILVTSAATIWHRWRDDGDSLIHLPTAWYERLKLLWLSADIHYWLFWWPSDVGIGDVRRDRRRLPRTLTR